MPQLMPAPLGPARTVTELQNDYFAALLKSGGTLGALSLVKISIFNDYM
jgi:hypothetical protein